MFWENTQYAFCGSGSALISRPWAWILPYIHRNSSLFITILCFKEEREYTIKQMIITLIGEYIEETNKDKRRQKTPALSKRGEELRGDVDSVLWRNDLARAVSLLPVRGFVVYIVFYSSSSVVIHSVVRWSLVRKTNLLYCEQRFYVCKERDDVFSFRRFRQNERTWWRCNHHVRQQRMTTVWAEKNPTANESIIESQIIITVFKLMLLQSA